MKRIIVLVFILPFYAAAQVDTIKLRVIADSVNNFTVTERRKIIDDSTEERYFSRKVYNRFFDKYFTQVKYERESFTEGNSASLKIAENKTRLNLTLSKKSGPFIFNVGTSLNISDNSGVLFSGDKPTAGTEFFGSFSYLILNSRSIGFTGPEQEINFRKRRALLDSIYAIHYTKNLLYGHVLNEKIRVLDSMYKRYETILNTPGTSNVLLYKDSLLMNLEKLTKAKEEATRLDDGTTTAQKYVQNLILKTTELGINKELETEGVTVVRFSWFTGGIGYRKDSYATYDSSLQFSKRMGETTFDRVSLNVTYNLFWQRTDPWIRFNNYKFFNSIYGNINYTLARMNSFESLKEQALSASRTRVQNDTTYEFSTQKKLRDISGKKFEADWMHRIGVVITTMMGKKQFVGLNLSTQGEVQPDKTVLNQRIGLLFRFIDSETQKSKVNFELFLAMNDLADKNKSGASAWQRKEIGVSANVPFQKVFFR